MIIVLFKEEYNNAESKIYEKRGWRVQNQFDGFTTLPDEFEVCDNEGKTLIDHLSIAQLVALAEIL